MSKIHVQGPPLLVFHRLQRELWLNFSKKPSRTLFIFNRIWIFVETFHTTPWAQHGDYGDHLVDVCPGDHTLLSSAPHLGPPLGLGRPRGLHWHHSRRSGAPALQLPRQMCAYLRHNIIIIIIYYNVSTGLLSTPPPPPAPASCSGTPTVELFSKHLGLEDDSENNCKIDMERTFYFSR